MIGSMTSPLGLTGVLLGSLAAGLIAHLLLFSGIGALARRVPAVLVLDGSLLRRVRGPSRLLLPLLAVELSFSAVGRGLSPEVLSAARHVLFILWVVAVAWLLVSFAGALVDVITRRFDLSVQNNLRARQIRTQAHLLHRVLIVGVLVLALATVLLRFEGFRTLGTGLLASAGVVGVVVGIAAQRPLANLLAGVQLALTQPIRVDDVVVIDGEVGRIEEITLTYVVVHLWDERKMVLPIGYFAEEPFQNWTRTSADLLGTAYLRVDHTAPVHELRHELDRVVRRSEHWDGRACRLHVTDAGERTMELRALVSARDADSVWELRCEVREELIAYLQRAHPAALPKLRTDAVAPREAFSATAG